MSTSSPPAGTRAGVIATSDPRASEVGAEILRSGGNAVDAAVASALALLVVEPHACGVAGDAFALYKREGEAMPAALDGSGAVPNALAAEAEGPEFVPVPLYGARSVTVPGAMHLFSELLDREGTLSLAGAVVPAQRLAQEGFAVRPTLAAAAARNVTRLEADPTLRALYLPDGAPVVTGDTVRNPALAEALGQLGERGVHDLYAGDLADAVLDASTRAGGYLLAADLSAHRTEPLTPVSGTFAGAEVWELPEPTQGPAVLASLQVLEDRGRYDTNSVIDSIVVGMRAAGIDLLTMQPESNSRGDTTYIACADADGFAVSLITSVFSDFGAGVGVPALGSPLHNRAAGTTLIGQRPRRGKPPHTTIPGMVTRGGELAYVLGVVGGYMQAQGQVQVLVNLLVHGMSPQDAIDAPRFRVLSGGGVIAAEEGHEIATLDPAAVGRDPGPGAFGGCQVASRTRSLLDSGSDKRRDGLAILV